jgi:hypothetical protein
VSSAKKKNAPNGVHAVALVDLRGIEPLTSSRPGKRAPESRKPLDFESDVGHGPVDSIPSPITRCLADARWHSDQPLSCRLHRQVGCRSGQEAGPRIEMTMRGVASPCSGSRKPLGTVTKGTFRPCVLRRALSWSDAPLGTSIENSSTTGDSRAPGHHFRKMTPAPSSPSSVLYFWARRGSSAVEQGTHKP